MPRFGSVHKKTPACGPGLFELLCLQLSLCRDNRHIRAVIPFFLELNFAINERVQSMVLAHSHVLARIMPGSALAHDNVSGDTILTTEDLYAESFTLRVATVV